MRRSNSRAGLTLIELTIAVALLAVMTMSLTLSLDRQARSLSAQTSAKDVTLNAEMMLDEIVGRLRYARWTDTRTQLGVGLGGGQNFLDTEEIAGFPPAGILVIEPGSDTAERVVYSDYDFAGTEFQTVQRGMLCTEAQAFPGGTVVQWAGLAVWTNDQVAPDVDEFDGISRELGREVFYVGDGIGLVFQVPIRAAGGDFFDANGAMTYGASVDGNPELGGYHAFAFQGAQAVLEAALGSDLNNDGDEVDVFDLGRIALLTWEASNPDDLQVAQISPAVFVQERCAYGSDLDGDGFDDPMFLLDPRTGRLRLRVFSLVRGLEGARLHRDEITTLLVNSIE